MTESSGGPVPPAGGDQPPPTYVPPTPAPPAYAPPPPVAPGAAVGDLAIKRSGVRCFWATLASFGVYSYYWFYQYRRLMFAELGKPDESGLHTAGLLVPIVNYYLIYLLWKDISDARVRVGLSELPVVAY